VTHDPHRAPTPECAETLAIESTEGHHWRHVFDHVQAGVGISALESDTVGWVNAAFAEMHGRSLDAFAALPIASLFPTDEHARLSEALETIRQQGRHAWRSRHLRVDGTTFPVWIEAVLVRDGDPPIRVVTVHDMSEWETVEQAHRSSEALLRKAHIVAGLGTWRFDLATGVFEASPEVLRLFDLDAPDPLTFDHFRPVFHPEDAPAVEDAWRAAVEGQHGYDLEYRLRVRGRVRWIHEAVAAAHEPGGLTGYLIGTVRDVTDRRERDGLVRRLAYALEQVPSIVVLTDTDGIIEYVNRRFEEATGRRREHVLGRSTREFRSGLNQAALYEDLWRTISAGEVWQGEFQNLRSSGEAYWEHATIAPVLDEGGVITHYVKLAEDVTATKAMRAYLDHLTFHDPLTGLANRALFLNRLEHALGSAQARSTRVGVLLADIDGFRAVNEAWGHVVGDAAARAVAFRLESCLREGDTIAHFAGGAFGVLAPAVRDGDEAARLAQRLHRALVEPITVEGKVLHVSVGIGIAVAPEDGDAPDVLLQRASAALHGAKAAGQRQTRFFSPGLDRRAQERFELETAFRRALAAGDLWVAYQPRIDLRHRRVVGFEALARWTDPVLGPIPPGRFVPLAETTGLIHELDHAVLARVLRQLRLWHDAGLEVLPVAVNLSAAEFERDDVVDAIASALDEAGVPPAWLEIELTESVAMRDVERTVTTIAALRELGVAVAIDDFGAGYASFAQLKVLPVTALKINLSFIRDLGEVPDASSRDATVVIGIIALATILGLDVVAEGVETEAQRDFLAAHGCGFAQGYWFGRPEAPEIVTPLLFSATA
jgi:diguanylate cyclase (GGDEF)-like protein/PAS domain S-box-containing protein